MSAMDILVVIYHLPAPACPTRVGPSLSVVSLMTVCKHMLDIQKLSFDCFKLVSYSQI